MNRPPGQALPADDAGRDERGRPGGLLAKLMAAVRPEFRADELVFEPVPLENRILV